MLHTNSTHTQELVFPYKIPLMKSRRVFSLTCSCDMASKHHSWCPSIQPTSAGTCDAGERHTFSQGIKEPFSQHTKETAERGYCAHGTGQARPHLSEDFPQSPPKSSVYSITHRGFFGLSVAQIEQKFSVPWDKSIPSWSSLPCRRNSFLSKAPVPSND